MSFKLIKAGVAAFALLAVPFAAQAADVPIKAPYYKGPHSVVSYYNWTGFYAGVNAGYGMGTSTWSALCQARHQAEGLPGRRHARLQLAVRRDRLRRRRRLRLVRREGQRRLRRRAHLRDLQSLARARSAAASATPSIAGCPTSPAAAPTAASKRPSTLPVAGAVSASSSQLGWTAGAGLEYAFMGNWTAKLEYLYVDLGSFDAGVAPAVNTVELQGEHRPRRPELQVLRADLLPLLTAAHRPERTQYRKPRALARGFCVAQPAATCCARATQQMKWVFCEDGGGTECLPADTRRTVITDSQVIRLILWTLSPTFSGVQRSHPQD